MKTILLSTVSLFLFALLIASASAAPLSSDHYLIVVGSDAPASDVVIAANFAASMKGSVAVTFASSTDKDAYGQLTAFDLQYMTVVVIDGQGQAVRILGGLHDDAWDATKVYFQRMGFSVSEPSAYTPDDLLLHPPVKSPPTQDSGAGQQGSEQGNGAGQQGNGHGSGDNDVTPDDTATNGTVTAPPPDVDVTPPASNTVLQPDDNAMNGSTNATPPIAPPVAPEDGGSRGSPGIFTRIWSWFAGLFG